MMSSQAWSTMKTIPTTTQTQMAVASCSRLREKITEHTSPTRPKTMVTTSTTVRVRRSMRMESRPITTRRIPRRAKAAVAERTAAVCRVCS